MSLPNFLIVGAAKSGTTSLYNYLRQHPDIFMPDWKEPSFFFDGLFTSVSSFEDYKALFSGSGDAKAVGEASPGYLYAEEAPGRILGTLGRIKIIAILRNPAERAYSMWNWQKYRYGFEELEFEEALEAEDARMADPGFRKTHRHWHGFYYYFHGGLYYRYVKRYMDEFGPENVKVVVFEELKEKPQEVLRGIFSFLGVDPAFAPEIKRHNPAATFKSRFAERLLISARFNPVLLAVYGVLPSRLKLAIYRLVEYVMKLNTKPRKAAPMPQELRGRLMDKYMDDIRRLESLTGMDLSVWYRA